MEFRGRGGEGPLSFAWVCNFPEGLAAECEEGVHFGRGVTFRDDSRERSL